MTQERLTTRNHIRDCLYRVWLLSHTSRFALRIHPARKSEQSLAQVDRAPGILRLAGHDLLQRSPIQSCSLTARKVFQRHAGSLLPAEREDHGRCRPVPVARLGREVDAGIRVGLIETIVALGIQTPDDHSGDEELRSLILDDLSHLRFHFRRNRSEDGGLAVLVLQETRVKADTRTTASGPSGIEPALCSL